MYLYVLRYSGGGGGLERERESWGGGVVLYLMFTGESYPPLPKKNNYAFNILNTCILSKNRFTRIPWLRICTRRKIPNFIIYLTYFSSRGGGWGEFTAKSFDFVLTDGQLFSARLRVGTCITN